MKNKKIIFALSYLLLIPIYAYIFHSLGDEFYHTTIKHENYLKEDEIKILTALKESMIDNYKQVNKSESLPEGYIFSLNEINFYNLNYQNGYYFFDALSSLESRLKELPPNPVNFKFTFSWARNKNKLEQSMYPLNITNKQNLDEILKELFPVNALYADYQPEGVGFIIISDSLKSELENYRDALSGFPSKSSGSYSRMLYLSAMTITTVGFGDIVPLTSRARLLIASEAILGIILIGLFVNAVFSKKT